jgi:hypothetical protein
MKLVLSHGSSFEGTPFSAERIIACFGLDSLLLAECGHFSPAGHALTGHELYAFAKSMIASRATPPPASPPPAPSP